VLHVGLRPAAEELVPHDLGIGLDFEQIGGVAGFEATQEEFAEVDWQGV
jgi:hypothetical protein